MDSEVPFTNLLRCNHHWPFCPALTLTRLTLTNLTLIPVIMRNLTILFPVIRAARAPGLRLWRPAVVPSVLPPSGDAVVTSLQFSLRSVRSRPGDG